MEKKKIYLAGSCAKDSLEFDTRRFMESIALCLRLYKEGNGTYCPFELKISDAWLMSQEDWSQAVFDKDKEAIDNCDVFLMISPGRNSSAGTNFEEGYAYAIHKHIIVLQYTEDDTSLMAFCGTTIFKNTNEKDIYKDMIDALNMTEEDLKSYKKVCTTVLT